MKLLRYGQQGQEKPGLLDGQGRLRDLSGVIPDVAGDALLPAALDRLRGLDAAALPLVPGTPRLGPCVGHVGKFICIGLNYADHAAEPGPPSPRARPLLEGDQRNHRPDDDISSRAVRETDWEVELGVVIG